MVDKEDFKGKYSILFKVNKANAILTQLGRGLTYIEIDQARWLMSKMAHIVLNYDICAACDCDKISAIDQLVFAEEINSKIVCFARCSLCNVRVASKYYARRGKDPNYLSSKIGPTPNDLLNLARRLYSRLDCTGNWCNNYGPCRVCRLGESIDELWEILKNGGAQRQRELWS